MTYSDKREFAATVFAAVPDRGPCGYDGCCECRDIATLLAQAQLDALPQVWEAEAAIASSLAMEQNAGDADERIDAAYALAVQLAPLVGVEVME